MPTTVVVGLQYGDEGKGKIVDMLAQEADVVVRYNGGANAGHTIVIDSGTYKLHLVPSGILNPGVRICVIGNGAVIDPDELLREIAMLEALGITVKGRFLISSNAHLVMPWHRKADEIMERLSGKHKIGSTGRGIGPCYTEKVARSGFRAEALRDPDAMRRRMVELMEDSAARARSPFSALIYAADGFQLDRDIQRWCAELGPYVADTDTLVRAEWKKGSRILLEAAQGTMIDLDYGSYPKVTSSYATAAGACIGSGLPPTAIERVVGVVKAYTTRVGEGPFPTEMEYCDVGERLRQAGNEFGTTTGRSRRCGWLDLPMVRYAAAVNGVTEIMLTKLDVLSGFEMFCAATCYKQEIIGGDKAKDMKIISELTASDINGSSGAYPLFKFYPGWSESIANEKDWTRLDKNARHCVEDWERHFGVRISAVATGPHRGAIIWR